MKAPLVKLAGWLTTTAVLLAGYNVTAYLAHWELPFLANVGIGAAASLIGVFVGEIAATRAYTRRMQKVIERQSSDG